MSLPRTALVAVVLCVLACMVLVFMYSVRPNFLQNFGVTTLLAPQNKSALEEAPKTNVSFPMIMNDTQVHHICGNWSQWFTELNRVGRLQSHTKYFGYECSSSYLCGGLGDRLSGIVTAFLYALLSHRAFFINHSRDKTLELAYDSRSIAYNDWPDIQDASHQVLMDQGVMGFSEHTNLWMQPKPVILGKIDWEGPVIHLRTNTYAYSPMVASQTLLEFNITENTNRTLGCVLNYLFSPSAKLKAVLHNLYKEYFPNGIQNYIIVGIHIRVGGVQHNSQADATARVPQSQINQFVSCAQHLIDNGLCHKLEGKRYVPETLTDTSQGKSKKVVKFFLASDSQFVKDSLKQQLPDFIVTSGIPSKHSDRPASALTDDDLLHMAADHWILAESDCTVISRSGFGESASSFGFVESIYYGYDEIYTSRSCVPVPAFYLR